VSIPAFTLKQIHYFVSASEARTLSEAALRLNISQGALTEALDELERHMQLRLFVRRKARGVSLTPAGRGLLAQARGLLNAADELKAAADHRGTLLSGRVSIACYLTLAPFVMPAVLSMFRTWHPSVELDLFYGSGEEIAERLHDGRSDIAVLYDFNLPVDTIHDRLYAVAARIVLAADHPLADRDVVDLADLAAEPLIQFGIEPALTNTRMIFEDVGVIPLSVMNAPSIELVRSLVGRGHGYSILLHHPDTNTSYEGKPVVVKGIARFTREFPVVLARSNFLRPSRRGEELRKFLLSCFGPGPASATPAQGVI